MDIFTRQDLDGLLRSSTPCLSLFLPTRPGGGEQDLVLLANLLGQAEQVLEHRGLRAAAARQFLEPVHRLTEDPDFRRDHAEGLAVYAAPERTRAWRLPMALTPQVFVGERFQVTPLLPLVNDARFFVLALAAKRVRLFEGTRSAVRALEPKDLPVRLEEALAFHNGEEPLLFPTGAPGRWAAVFDSPAGLDAVKDDLPAYFQTIDRGLDELLRDLRCPLLLASVEYLWAVYRQANHYPHLLEEGIPGDPERLGAEDRHRLAWPLIDNHLRQARAEVLALHGRLAGTGRTTDNPGQIVAAARDGVVEALLAERDRPCWGAVNCVARGILCNKLRRPGDEDLVNVAALHTLLHSGAVHLFDADDLPKDVSLPTAVLRVGHARPFAPARAASSSN